MNRSRFFQHLFAVIGLSSFRHAEARTAAPVARYVLQRSPVRGFYYRQPPELLQRLRLGDSLTFRAEPDNSHDSKAVMVWWQNQHIGYLPRENNAHASCLLRQGLCLCGRITGLHPDHLSEPVTIEVLIMQPTTAQKGVAIL